jgi:hypothetical protein
MWRVLWASLAVCAALPTCFNDESECVDLTTYISDEAERGTLAKACKEFPGFHVFSNQCTDERKELEYYASGGKSGLWFSNATLNKYMSDWIALAMYPGGTFEGVMNYNLRQWGGNKVNSSYRNAMVLTASGFNRIRAMRQKMLPASRQQPSVVFRGVSTFDQGKCSGAHPSPQRYQNFSFVNWQFQSTSFSAQIDLSWLGSTGTFLVLKLRGGGSFAAPWFEEDEIDVMPGTR